VVQHRAVVGEADRRPRVPNQLEEPVLLGRELDEPVQRIAEDQTDHDDDRRDQPVRRRSLPETAPPPRPKGSLDGGNHARACLLHAYDWFSTEAMLSLADCAACFTVSLPVRI